MIITTMIEMTVMNWTQPQLTIMTFLVCQAGQMMMIIIMTMIMMIIVIVIMVMAMMTYPSYRERS